MIHRHSYERLEARLLGMADQLEAGGTLPDWSAETARRGAEIVALHGETLVRLKAALGMAIVRAVQEEEEAATEVWRPRPKRRRGGKAKTA